MYRFHLVCTQMQTRKDWFEFDLAELPFIKCVSQGNQHAARHGWIFAFILSQLSSWVVATCMILHHYAFSSSITMWLNNIYAGLAVVHNFKRHKETFVCTHSTYLLILCSCFFCMAVFCILVQCKYVHAISSKATKRLQYLQCLIHHGIIVALI